MTPWQEAIYDFPDDQGSALFSIVGKLPAHALRQMVNVPYGGFRLRLSNPKAMVLLRMSVSGLITPSGDPLLDPYELLVPHQCRAACDAILQTLPGCAPKWTELESISGDPAALQAFDALWAADVLPRL